MSGAPRILIADVPQESTEELTRSLHGQLIWPDDENWSEACSIWNGAVDIEPGLVAKCLDADDVATCVRFAQEERVLASVRAGGHGVAGHALCAGGLVIDLTQMNVVTVDPESQTAHCQGGVTWGDFDRAAEDYGLATTGGQISTTGVAGLTLGGGIGWLMREFGACVDNLLSVDVVNAEGEFVTASASENEDLFWALRGGGGNFGIATSLEFRLHPVPSVLAGAIFWPATQAGDIVRLYRELSDDAPNNLTLMTYFVPRLRADFIPPELLNTPMVAIAVCCTGDDEQRDSLVARLRGFNGPIGDSLATMAYTRLQSMFDITAPFGMSAYWKSCYLTGLSDEAIDTIERFAKNVSSPLSQILVTEMGGALRDQLSGPTSFGHRTASHVLEIIAKWTEGPSAPHEAWANEFFEAMRPFATGGSYVNFLGDEGPERIRAAYEPASFDRLTALKAQFDPDNFFSSNQNIPTQP